MQRRAVAQHAFIANAVDSPIRGWKALDVGCGLGALVTRLTEEGVEAVGVDSDPRAVRIGRRRWRANVHFAVDGRLQTHDEFDLVCMSHVVEHMPEVTNSMVEILQAVRPRGYVFIEVPNLFAERFVDEADMESHIHFFTQHSLAVLLDAVGLKQVACVTCGPPKARARDFDHVPRPHRSLFTRVTNVIKRLPTTIGQATGRLAIETIYDDYFDKSYTEDDGIWIRCLALPYPHKYGWTSSKPRVKVVSWKGRTRSNVA